jgi:hypothetical protein
MLSIDARHCCSGTAPFLHMSVNAHNSFDGKSAQKLCLLHITTPLRFLHVLQILQQAKSPRSGNKLALPFPRSFTPVLSFWRIEWWFEPEGCNDSEVTGFDRLPKQVEATASDTLA